MGEVSITNRTRGRLPSLPLVLMKDEILGKEYSLSLVYVGEKKSKELNNKYRNKNKPTNILSFSLSGNSGEIIICPSVVKKEYKKWNKSFRDFLGFLVIHGMLHLEGMEHGSIMERLEQKYDKKYFYRDRHRNNDDKSRGWGVRKGRKKS